MTTPNENKTPSLAQENAQETPAIIAAISRWRAGQRIDSALYERLKEEGYDVPSLERFYFNK